MSGQTTIARLREFGLRPDTRLGQHFLVDDNLVRLTVSMADLHPDDVVVEVGPGLGVLTRALANAVAHVHAVEIDRRLEAPLAATLGPHENVAVVWGDALRIDLAALRPAPTAFVSNLPYSIATPLIAESLAGLPTVDRWCVMVQREAAARLFALPGSAAYGAVSVLVGLGCIQTATHSVSRHVFAPPPRVDSTLVAFRRSDAWPALAPRFEEVRRVVQAAFAVRRKTLANALVQGRICPRETTVEILASLGYGAAARAEELSPAAFLELTNRLGG